MESANFEQQSQRIPCPFLPATKFLIYCRQMHKLHCTNTKHRICVVQTSTFTCSWIYYKALRNLRPGIRCTKHCRRTCKRLASAASASMTWSLLDAVSSSDDKSITLLKSGTRRRKADRPPDDGDTAVAVVPADSDVVGSSSSDMRGAKKLPVRLLAARDVT